jgi:hypothetical protein
VSVLARAAALVEGALATLDAERSLINDLNVYPVPDGDTGTNLFLTVRAIQEELARTSQSDVVAVASAITKGSLMGARGNSGVILSQIVRGMCSECRPGRTLDVDGLKRAFREGTAAAYRAVKQPVEGTMLTVIREMSAAADRLPDDAPLGDALTAILASGHIAVEHTQRQLAALRQAGVVDAGGYGLLVIFRGLAEALQAAGGRLVHAVPTAVADSFAVPRADEPTEMSRFRYCTSFLLSGESLPREYLEDLISSLGDSMLLVGDQEMLKVHIHTDDPGAVLSRVVPFGGISEVEINDMHQQTRERDQRLAAARRAGGTAVVAVVAGEGNKELFRELGCAAIVDGGQSMNPSAAQLLEAVEQLESSDVVILPNNGNVVLTAEQAAGMSPRHIVVVPATSIPAGIAAMVAFEATADAAANVAAMEEALAANHSAEITVAVRDSFVGDVSVRKDQVIGLVDDRLVAKGDTLLEVFEEVVRVLTAYDPDVITVLTSLNGDTPTAEDLHATVASIAPTVEIAVHRGGQPLYPLLIGAE